ncbi:hypothetical protein K474DRAFT_1708649 [Panus rudis PR-1116 ss-1]|nr:hypothetical protein K474DRAFT_1708649 [Panus rudis PR-1116 ss-1]
MDEKQDVQEKVALTSLNQAIKSAPLYATPLLNSDEEQVKVLGQDVKEYIEAELKTTTGGFVRDYPVVDVIRQVYGVSPEDIPIGISGYTLARKLIKEREIEETITYESFLAALV